MAVSNTFETGPGNRNNELEWVTEQAMGEGKRSQDQNGLLELGRSHTLNNNNVVKKIGGGDSPRKNPLYERRGRTRGGDQCSSSLPD